jgi:hypothetical protein
MSEGGNPFRNIAARGQTLSNGKPFPDESDTKYEDMLNYIDFSKWARILDKKSCDHYLGPPNEIMCTAPTSPNSSAKENEGWVKVDVPFDRGWVNDVPFDEDPFEELNKHRQDGHHNGQHQEHHHHQREVLHRGNDFESHDIQRDKLTRKAKTLDSLGKQHPTQSWRRSDDGFFSNISQDADSRRRAPQLEIPKPSSLKNNRYGKAQSERQWHEDDELVQNKWSPKRLMCGMKGNEVVSVDLEFSAKPYPRKLEDVRLQASLRSFTLQDKRETSPYLKLNKSERISSKSLPQMGLSRSAKSLPPALTRSMQSSLDEKPAKPHTASRREWFERSDSMKGRTVSNKSHVMQMVFFQTIGEECKPEEYDDQSHAD